MRIFIFGLGYSAEIIAQRLLIAGAGVAGTVRTAAKAERLSDAGLTVRLFSGEEHDAAIAEDLAASDAVLISVPPQGGQDLVLRIHGADLAAASHLRWIGYLSTVGVYGDHGGGWVDEGTAETPSDGRSRERLAVERQWLAFGAERDIPTHIFRLSGIYGPGRNQLVQLAEGKARRIVKPGQVFNRIHVADVAQLVEASLARPRAGAIYNGADDEPAPPQDVVTFAAALCGVQPPPEIAFDEADMTPMSRSFFMECKRVHSQRTRAELGVTLQYPTYREGLTALRAAGDGPA
ncbi:SDR family oxidoreductase [Bradyrhizobium sp. U87765 SZCCT0131]|uniref:SDR family oxidoreductase n=1 Tax=unclassified Bradyrhizobium TaxID=2631580 RepID=UPI001BA89919|nr:MULTISPECIES: SDR family oxidoreductase [unclassified Bradyrhizobium]MBR1222597.1 SDR family oxidoreductase [Bradyrhizobium sp. U87765 SZCCT0131]MBR1265322.1 SDR family oxidoreductase [Bradyrhizobium sp. U87765 SZCCT0134]MBR1302899.1 SDR family oxidoreductase [Bradyrhizobium sp. U87765 SZCCT0110]MBR1323597.1 SDR family oxidoreductase [Bradyrhizobium sp. U87765 SZCCT0109]MBR1346828.1 SDR family oxidoreductase [Bradyrhizobium sp. U87765 SZCCT0048]